jgi:hypothetical protein
MIQTLKKYRFWVFSALALLNIGLNMQGVEMPFPIDSLYLPLLLLAVMSVPTNFDKEEKQS